MNARRLAEEDPLGGLSAAELRTIATRALASGDAYCRRLLREELEGEFALPPRDSRKDA